MTVPRKRAIVWYQAGQLPGRNYIESSIGYPYAELTRIAKKMNHNGEGSRYKVVRYVPPEEDRLPGGFQGFLGLDKL